MNSKKNLFLLTLAFGLNLQAQTTCDSIGLNALFAAQTNGSLVQFVDQSNTAGFNAIYTWDFGDGNTSSQQSPVHTYAQPGGYIACLSVEIGPNNGNDSCFATFCDTIFISSMPSGCDSTAFVDVTGQDVGNGAGAFSALGNVQFDGYNWNFGDSSGVISGNVTQLHQYVQPGIYTVCVDAWYVNQFQDTCTVTDCAVITIGGMSMACDTTQFVFFQPSPTGPGSFFFNGTGSMLFGSVVHQ